MAKAFSRTFNGAPFRNDRYRRAAMDTAVKDILRAHGISFARGTLEADRIIHSISRLANGSARRSSAEQSASRTITREVIIAMTIEIAKAHKQIYGDVRAIHPDSLKRISSGLARIVRDEGRHPVIWHDDLPINWPNELALHEREHSPRKS